LTVHTLFHHLFWLAHQGHSRQSINVLQDEVASRFQCVENPVPELRKALVGKIGDCITKAHRQVINLFAKWIGQDIGLYEISLRSPVGGFLACQSNQTRSEVNAGDLRTLLFQKNSD
jgi:hypothetical protein